MFTSSSSSSPLHTNSKKTPSIPLHATYHSSLLVISSTTSSCPSPAALLSLPEDYDGVSSPTFLGNIPLNSTSSAFHVPKSSSKSTPSPSSSSLLLGYSTPDGPKVAITKLHVSSSHLLNISSECHSSPFKISLVATKRLGVERNDFVSSIVSQPNSTALTVVATLSNSCRLFVIKDDVERGPVHASLKCCNEDRDEVR